MPIVSIELPSGEIRKEEFNSETTLRELVVRVGLLPLYSIFFCGRQNGVVGTLIGLAGDDLFESFNINTCSIVDIRKL